MNNEPPMKYMQYTPTTPCGRREPPVCGLLRYRQWWERREADLCVCGKLIRGTPIFVEEDAVRVVNCQYSYFIPLDKIDFIRTDDGLCAEAPQSASPGQVLHQRSPSCTPSHEEPTSACQARDIGEPQRENHPAPEKEPRKRWRRPPKR